MQLYVDTISLPAIGITPNTPEDKVASGSRDSKIIKNNALYILHHTVV